MFFIKLITNIYQARIPARVTVVDRWWAWQQQAGPMSLLALHPLALADVQILPFQVKYMCEDPV